MQNMDAPTHFHHYCKHKIRFFNTNIGCCLDFVRQHLRVFGPEVSVGAKRFLKMAHEQTILIARKMQVVLMELIGENKYLLILNNSNSRKSCNIQKRNKPAAETAFCA